MDDKLSRKLVLRLIPFLFLLYVVATIDRTNVSFAKLQMNQLPWWSETVYGLGAGIFFIGYFIFEVPSNLILERVGARWWIARIMITWGMIAAAMMFTTSAPMFYLLRFLLGVAEAGFFPGMILYMTYWFTRAERGKIVALLMLASPASGILGGPISGLLLQLNGVGGLKGWQWLFLLEGIPAMLLGLVVLAYLPNSPEGARWLSADEKGAIAQRLTTDQEQSKAPSRFRFSVVLPFFLIYFMLNVAGYGVSMWLPQIIAGFGKLAPFQVGLLSVIPSIAGAVSMLVSGWHSDRTGERKMHVSIGLLLTTVGLIVSSQFSTVPWLALAALSLANMGTSAAIGPFWALSTSRLSRTAAAGGIALINSFGNIGGFVGPFAVGWIKNRTHSFEYPLLTLAATACVGGLIAASLRTGRVRDASG